LIEFIEFIGLIGLLGFVELIGLFELIGFIEFVGLLVLASVGKGLALCRKAYGASPALSVKKMTLSPAH